MHLVLLTVLLGALSAFANQPTYNNPDFLIVLGQNDLLPASPLVFGAPAIAGMLQIQQGWTVANVTAFWLESIAWYASQYGIVFTTDGSVNCLGFSNSIAFSVSTTCQAYLTPLTAVGKYRVYSASNPTLGFNVPIDPRNPPLIHLIEFVVEFDFEGIIPGWQFAPFDYGGAFAAANGLPAAVEVTDNLSFGIYNIGLQLAPHLDPNFNVFMRVDIPDKTSPVAAGRSRESQQVCSILLGAGLGALRVDAFIPTETPPLPAYPTSATGVWHFFLNPQRAALPSLYSYAPQVFPGNRSPSCLASISH